MVRYTQQQVQEEAKQWINGELNQKDMTPRQWMAMKRRINRAGIFKQPAQFKASSKGISNAEWNKRRNKLARDRYQEKREKQQQPQVETEHLD
jgi:hypothetical protein